MAEFNQAIETTLMHEGGFSDDPADRGGATRYGISLRFLTAQGYDIDGDGDVDADDIRSLTLDGAIDIYREKFWNINHYDQIKSQAVATKVFDFTVNMGAKRAAILLQRALQSCGFALKQDGKIGPATFSAINSASSETLLAAYRSEAAGYYRLITQKTPDFERFINGWLRRAYS
ncbi:MAG: N-acetylmuramidase [Gammaproteobacteria bacterium]|nr:N-acetylmuramidase [Gammaproteobacteria bacterium]